jgi:hypothetical protein
MYAAETLAFDVDSTADLGLKSKLLPEEVFFAGGAQDGVVEELVSSLAATLGMLEGPVVA